jgi:hypothetical protein
MPDQSGSDVILYADGFLLRPWKIEDAGWYVASRDEEIFKWTNEKRDLTEEEKRKRLNHWLVTRTLFVLLLLTATTCNYWEISPWLSEKKTERARRLCIGLLLGGAVVG